MSISEEYNSAQLMFDSFAALKKEKLSDLIDRFITVANNLKKHDHELTNHEQIQRLLESLPLEWSLHVKNLKKERMFSDYKLLDVIDKLKSFELDIKRKEFFEAMIQPQTNTPNVSYDDNMEEEDLKWQIKSLTVRARRFIERTWRNVCTDDKIEIREVQSQINYALMTKIVDVQIWKSKCEEECEESLKDDEGKKKANFFDEGMEE
ncbi:hypothetical protein QVD17_16591 [Tagetes erecta]|uniref:Uncharacterized protein n=1 Tax=Tagetes erecta TaxID=13708 RepID=A0AAD8KUK5_TARER|nr:hypothetical protein QVD17_16591 [Tagetes erecta]